MTLAVPPRADDPGLEFWALPEDEEALGCVLEEGERLLSPAERQRHNAMRSEKAARRFIRGRTLLRLALARNLEIPPHEIAFELTARGKPLLSRPRAEGLTFNLSHSGEEALLAITRYGEIGIDIEEENRGASVLRIAACYFSEAERRQIDRLPDGPERSALKVWTLKESAVKAIGASVWDGMTEVCPSLSGEEIGWLSPPPAGTADEWVLMLGTFRDRYILALALRAPGLLAEQARAGGISWRAQVLGVAMPATQLFRLKLVS